MRCATSSSIFIMTCLICSSNALPFSSREAPRPLQPRAKYSVVAVDGSSNDSNSPAVVLPNPSPKSNPQPEVQTKTVTATPVDPPISVVTVVATKLVQPIPVVQPNNNPKANVAIVNVSAAPSSTRSSTSSTSTSSTSQLAPATQPTTPSCSSTDSPNPAPLTRTPQKPEPVLSTQTLQSTTIVSSSSPTSSPQAPSLPTPAVLWDAKINLASPPEITTSSTLSRTYDDGFWHTTWRVWNATSSTHSPQSTPSKVPVW